MSKEAKNIGEKKEAKTYMLVLKSFLHSVLKFVYKSCFTTLLVLLFIFIAWIYPIATGEPVGANLYSNSFQIIFFAITVCIAFLILVVQIYARHKWPMKAKCEAKKAIERKSKEAQV